MVVNAEYCCLSILFTALYYIQTTMIPKCKSTLQKVLSTQKCWDVQFSLTAVGTEDTEHSWKESKNTYLGSWQ